MTYEQEIQRLKDISPYYLPLNAAESGLTAEQIKEKMYAGLFFLLELIEQARQAYASADQGLANDISALSLSITALASRVSTLENSLTLAAITTLQNQVAALQSLTGNHTTSIETIQAAIITINANIATLRSDIVNGTISAYKAVRDGDGNIIKTTYATKVELSVATSDITKIKNGGVTVGKALQDQNGDRIDTTYVKIANIVNALNDTSTTKPLSAAQGKALKEALDTLSNYIYNGASNTSIDRLAEVFAFLTGHDDDETLDGILAGKVSIADLVDNLTTENASKALTAKQGYVLKGLVDLKVAIADIVDNLTTENASKPLSAKQGKALKALIDALDVAKADASAVYTKEDAEDMVDEKIAGIESVNVISDVPNSKNYDYQILLRADNEIVLRLTEVE